jgi:hypothetical protein
MRCPVHGVLDPKWTSCPHCIRDQRLTQSHSTHPRQAAPGQATSSTGEAVTIVGDLTLPPNDVTVEFPPGPGPVAAEVEARTLPHPVPGGAGEDVTRLLEGTRTVPRTVRAWLIEKDGETPDAVYRLKDAETLIGRDETNDIVIKDGTVSRFQCKIWVEGAALRLLNISSSNWTHVNGARVEAPVTLAENDAIAMGSTVLVLKWLGPPGDGTDAPGPSRP